ncbi:hypothetical protein KI387_004836, partial [Taxus chinensis]
MASSLQNEVDLPFIDFSQFSFESEGLKNLQNHPGVATVREACKEWGFFRIINTGIPNEVFQNLESVSHELRAMPQEVKDRVITSNPIESYYRSSNKESFWFPSSPHSDSLLAFSHKIWPEKGNPKLCETIGAYTSGTADLQCKITIIILASLGLDAETFYHSDFEKCTSYMRIHLYNSDGKLTKDEEALFAHTDPNCFTILYQDNDGGLQIKSNQGNCMDVKPLSNSLLVNIGELLKAWSNGRYRSVEHRVIYKGWTNRISVVWTVEFPYDKEIWAPAELVDQHHPRCFHPFTFSQVLEASMNHGLSQKGNQTSIDSYAQMSIALKKYENLA